jgi:actin-related protein
MGFSGNVEPSYIIPTCIGVNDAVSSAAAQRRGSALEDLDFAIGNEARCAAPRQRAALLRTCADAGVVALS